MPTTEPVYGWPLPVGADPPDLPAQLSALADAIAATMRAQTFVQTGTLTLAAFTPGVDFPSRSAGNPLTFPIAFVSTPVVVASMSSGWRWAEAKNITVTGCEIDAFDIRRNAESVDDASWWAIGPIDPANLP